MQNHEPATGADPVSTGGDGARSGAIPRRPIFDYATGVDPAMSAFGWQFIVLAYLAAVIPLLAIVLPRDAATHWTWVAVGAVVAVATIGLNLLFVRAMMDTRGWREPPAWVVLAQAVVVTVATAGLNFALSGTGGFFRPIILVPSILVAIIGNRAMVAASTMVTVVAVTLSARAQGVDHGYLPAFAFAYGTSWTLIIVMVHLLSVRALEATQHSQGVAEAAAIAARADRLDEGLERLLPVVGVLARARRVTAYGIGEAGTAVLDHWPATAEPGTAPTPTELERARADEGSTLAEDRAVLLAERDGEVAVALVVEGPSRSPLGAITYQFHMKRMAAQLDTLVARSRHIERLESLGRTDSLTGLPNRRGLEEQLERERALAARRRAPLSLVMVDLDDFKAYNDAHGHPAGDELLHEFSAALRSLVRAGDFVARYGGEEFCILLPNTSARGATELVDQLRQGVRAHTGADLPAFSAGVALSLDDETSHDLLKRADQALYAAKAAGKDRTVVA